jgi:23S rRNA pseudouridine1911/1915/1917 synthase
VSEADEPAITVVVAPGAVGQRVDRVLAEALASHALAPSRAELQRWIEAGRVTSGRAPVRAADKARAGQVFEVAPASPRPSVATPDPSVVFAVLYADDDVVVVDKPAGLVVHPAHGHPTGTLVNGLLARGYFDRDDLLTAAEPAREEDEDEPSPQFSRPGIVHRIDKDTSGVLVVARTTKAREHLKAQFAAHACDRAYDALAVGVVAECTYSTLYGRNPKERMLFSSRVREGKHAVTHVTPKERFGARATLVECRLETGRTHQIRVHLSDAGHPLLGDTMYGKVPRDPALARIAGALGRQALHARRLGFRHPRTNEPLVFESPWPDDFVAAVSALRGG